MNYGLERHAATLPTGIISIAHVSPYDPRDLQIKIYDYGYNRDRDRFVDPIAKWARSVLLKRYIGPIQYLDMYVKQNQIELRAEMRVPDIDSGNSLSVGSTTAITYGVAPPCTEALNALLRRLLVDCTLHELDECLLVDGVRVFDPHRKEATAVLSP